MITVYNTVKCIAVVKEKARRADKNHESGNRGDEKGGECVNAQRADENESSALKIWGEGSKEKGFSKGLRKSHEKSNKKSKN